MSDEKIKVYFVESTDPYGDRGIVGSQGFFDESQANALEAEQQEKFGGVYLHMVQEIYVVFSHRNGESEHPQVDGAYLYRVGSEWHVNWIEKGKWLMGEGSMMYMTPVWGPIPMPEVV